MTCKDICKRYKVSKGKGQTLGMNTEQNDVPPVIFTSNGKDYGVLVVVTCSETDQRTISTKIEKKNQE